MESLQAEVEFGRATFIEEGTGMQNLSLEREFQFWLGIDLEKLRKDCPTLAYEFFSEP
jgi:hypothetical protein